VFAGVCRDAPAASNAERHPPHLGPSPSVTHFIALPATLTSLLFVASPVLAGGDGRTEPTVEPPAALLVVLAGVSGPADCLVNDSAFTTAEGGCLDLATGVVWGTYSQFGTSASALTWTNAMAYCDGLAEGGYSDWYLPSKAQMLEAFAHGSASHLNVIAGFWPWSSTTKGSQRAWIVSLTDGTARDVLKGSILSFICVRDAATLPTTPPAAPTGLDAFVASVTQINLSWTDASSDEVTFQVDRSIDELHWATVATLPANSQSYGDGSLAPGQLYYYRVWAANAGGASGFSNTASATVPGGDSLAYAETAGEGIVSGDFQDTWQDDGIYESITEYHNGGPPGQRQSRLEHKWNFTVASGATVTLHVQGHRIDTGEGDTFVFAYAGPGGGFTNLPGALTATVDNGAYTTFALPPMSAGSIEIRVRDSNRQQGFGAQDVLHIDHIYITSF
jgi:hypothetical protein